MSAMKNELTYLINHISDDKLSAIKPLLTMLYDESIEIERVAFDDLDDDEKEAVLAGMRDYERRETMRAEDIDWDSLDD